MKKFRLTAGQLKIKKDIKKLSKSKNGFESFFLALEKPICLPETAFIKNIGFAAFVLKRLGYNFG